MNAPEIIQSPLAKAATAIAAGTGTSVISLTTATVSFLPENLSGWLAAAASAAALLYSLMLILEWLWKRVWIPLRLG